MKQVQGQGAKLVQGSHSPSIVDRVAGPASDPIAAPLFSQEVQIEETWPMLNIPSNFLPVPGGALPGTNSGGGTLAVGV